MPLKNVPLGILQSAENIFLIHQIMLNEQKMERHMMIALTDGSVKGRLSWDTRHDREKGTEWFISRWIKT